MPADRRAVLFDLDDTLYALRDFRLSGFRAVAAHVAATRGLDAEVVFASLVAAADTHPRRECDELAERLGLARDAALDLVDVFRRHRPRISLAPQTAATLATLRRRWHIGIVTNGRPDIQARKITALGLAPTVDAIVFANEHGSGAGKPEAAPFLAACQQLGVSPSESVFVGDDLRCDIGGARAVGMATVWVPPPTSHRGAGAAMADLVVTSIEEVPKAADRLLSARWSAHVA